jgi:hypothetical protein
MESLNKTLLEDEHNLEVSRQGKHVALQQKRIAEKHAMRDNIFNLLNEIATRPLHGEPEGAAPNKRQRTANIQGSKVSNAAFHTSTREFYIALLGLQRPVKLRVLDRKL